MKNTWGIFFGLAFCCISFLLKSQDSTTISMNAYVDTYYGYDFNEPANNTAPYLVSSARHNDFSINLAMLDFEYGTDRVRGRFATGFGSYMNANYAAEVGSFRNIVEATAGVKLSKKKEVWVDAGIMGAPFSYEGAVSKDQLLYSRSLAAEGSPYYVTGVKLTAPLAKNFTGAFYIVNGWQQITDVNNQKSVIGHLEYHPKNWSINLASILGQEQNLGNTGFRERLLVDFSANYKPKDKPFHFSVGSYYGNQKVELVGNRERFFNWFQANIAANYSFDNGIGLAARVEHFNDANAVIYTPVIGNSFEVTSITVGGSYKINPFALFRLEARNFIGAEDIYIAPNGNATQTTTTVWASLAINFGRVITISKAPLISTN